MTETSAIAADIELPSPSPVELAPRFLQRAALVIGAVALGDFLLFDRYVGISLFLFYAALAGALLIGARPPLKTVLPATLALALGLLPLVEEFSLLSFAIASVALALFAIFIAADGSHRNDLLRPTLALLIAGPFQWLPDIARARRAGRFGASPASVKGWLLPLGCGTIFLLLFGAANPLIDGWIAEFNPLRLLAEIGIGRIIVWLLLLMIAWPIILPRVRRWRIFNWRPRDTEDGFVASLFTPQSVLRSLILFNLLFAVHTAMDIVYLWGGIALPDGMTYANYAHRGAYPLIVTALLAAIFVLIAMPARGTPQPLIRNLVLIFILQNVMLVVSSMLRLDLYIETYSLTLLRVAAFIWMGLVAFGLALILARIVLKRSNNWLVAGNLIALAATLYICAFVDFSGIVASYNVTRHIEHGTDLDRSYLYALGPAALPAMSRLRDHDWKSKDWNPDSFDRLTRKIGCITSHLRKQMEDWRGWTFEGQRLLNYLDAQASAKPHPPEEDRPQTGNLG